ncbi:MAG: IPT/TIG domain-containing protein [candidate division KSB1 bacterium]|nr:IPT/TIG domain-containing protein [candidate division KSB1 bacterium]
MRWEKWLLPAGAGLCLLAALALSGCEAPTDPMYNTYGGNIPDPFPSGRPAARLDSLRPQSGYLKDIVILYGSGFDPDPVYNFVAFGKRRAEVLEASENMLKVRAPNISGETVEVKVAVRGSEFWSNSLPFEFLNALEVINEDIVWPNGVAVDENDYVYVGSAAEGVIYRIGPDRTKEVFCSVPISGSMEFGPGGYLYVCAQHEGKIVRVSPDGSTVEDVVTVEHPVDFDWDANGNLYIVSNGIGIHRLDPGGDLKLVAEIENPKSIRVFGNNVWVTDIWNGKIYKYDITSEGLENQETVYEGEAPVGLEFDAEGTMYFTEAWETSLYSMKPDGSIEVLYEGQLMTPMRYLTFYGKKLYIVFPGWGEEGKVVSAYIGVMQAPNYGRGGGALASR